MFLKNMNKMAIVLVIVLFCIKNTFADSTNNTCDMCIGQGSRWCFKENYQGENCVGFEDDACPAFTENEVPHHHDKIDMNGILVSPVRAERMLNFLGSNVDISYISHKPLHVKIKNDEYNVKIAETNHNCNNDDEKHQCIVSIKASLNPEYCKDKTKDSIVEIYVTIGDIKEVVTIQYYIQCQCDCTAHAESKSIKCNKHGQWKCGVCYCEFEWGGPECRTQCTQIRGDYSMPIETRCTDPEGTKCSGNGECKCNECVCDLNKEGSRYFRPNDKCSDVCMRSEHCVACTDDCEGCNEIQAELPLNRTTLDQDLLLGVEKYWIKCHAQKDGCNITYYAKEEEYDESIPKMFVMMEPNPKCEEEKAAFVPVAQETNDFIPTSTKITQQPETTDALNNSFAGPAGTGTTSAPVYTPIHSSEEHKSSGTPSAPVYTPIHSSEEPKSSVPMIVGLLFGGIVALAALGGVLWKYLHPPVQTESCTPLDGAFAEPSTGVNPLYKNPITFTKNPAYGKLL